MKDLIEYMVKNIVNNPDDVKIDEMETTDAMNADRKSVIYSLNLNPEDIGIVIGKSGQTIKSIRSIAKIKAIKEGYYVDIQINENNNSEENSD